MLKVNRKLSYRLYPSSRQLLELSKVLRLHQQLYNAALEHRINAYKKTRKSIGFFNQCPELTELRKELPEYDSLNAQSCQVTLKRLDLAFKVFFQRVQRAYKPTKPIFSFNPCIRFCPRGLGAQEIGDIGA